MAEKTARRRFHFLRRAYSYEYLLNFYVASIISLLATRTVLELLEYPIIGTQVLHISHALDGGMFMFAALILQMLFVDQRVMQFSSLLAGFGFGRFIDEVGKYITWDNDYFYQPAVVIIYFFYLGLFVLLYKIRYGTHLTHEERVANAHLKASEVQPNFLWKIQKSVRKQYRKLEEKPQFQRVVRGVLYIYTLLVFANTYRITLLHHTFIPSIPSVGQFVSNIAAAVCILVGATYHNKSKYTMYVWYQRAVLVWIFLTQVFIFYEDQFSAVVYLAGSLVLLGAVRYMKDEEKVLRSEQARALSSG